MTPQPSALWTPPLVKDLLHSRLWKFDRHPWPEWLAQHGGLEAVLVFIRSCPIPVQLQALLSGILEQPGQSRDYYAAMIGLHPATVSEHVSKLALLLTMRLNQWEINQPAAPNIVAVVPLQVVPLHELAPALIDALTACLLAQQPALAQLEREIGGVQ